jgi:hypothetical protein
MSIQAQVEQIMQSALARAELERLCARLALFERDVEEAERLTGQPWRRGRVILEQARARLAWSAAGEAEGETA